MTTPYVIFDCSRQNKTFCIPRESIIHVETFTRQEPDNNLIQDLVDKSKTFVRFKNPDGENARPLHAVVDMSVRDFLKGCIAPAWETETVDAVRA